MQKKILKLEIKVNLHVYLHQIEDVEFIDDSHRLIFLSSTCENQRLGKIIDAKDSEQVLPVYI